MASEISITVSLANHPQHCSTLFFTKYAMLNADAFE